MAHYASACPETITSAVEYACAAPSVHNVQPWSWRLQRGQLSLYVDRRRSIPVEDPDGRQLIISCGGALHHLRIALEHNLLEPIVTILPDHSEPDLLASITFRGRAHPEGSSAALFSSLERRRTDRRQFDAPPVGSMGALAHGAKEFGASMTILARQYGSMLEHASAIATQEHRNDPDYWNELEEWIRSAGSDEGIPRDALPDVLSSHESASARAFPSGHLKIERDARDHAALVLLSTPSDAPIDWLNAGQALSSVLLHATASHLASCPLTHLTEVEASREIVRDVASRSGETFQNPQVMIRIGLKPHGTETDTGDADSGANEPIASGRRAIEDVLTIVH
ncbi:hypothetical protein [Rhodococcus sp. IEGM 1379]|uniref:Acg family FMN-binding oxidoreductase n=1 Tax=Rhodococcus sp. IEGM 1379 TaxID=3047086 RepID=UPI0024B66B2D|nr:hypothetical protein [Rhodococcus sp. IEGM 1379]MDI9914467.1 hypothetical protein [Rhodococcus sp. IEGM 1379]